MHACLNRAPTASWPASAGVGTPLGGGVGLLTRAFGLGADNILAAQLVVANGSLVRSLEQSDG